MTTNSQNISTDPIKDELLTDELIELLLRRVSARLSDVIDFEVVEHYMTSIGRKGFVKRMLRDQLIFSYEEAAHALGRFFHPKSGKAYVVLLVCIRLLEERVDAGEKIY